MKSHLLYLWNVRCTATNVHVETILGGKTCTHMLLNDISYFKRHDTTPNEFVYIHSYIWKYIYILYIIVYKYAHIDSIKLPTSPYQPVTRPSMPIQYTYNIHSCCQPSPTIPFVPLQVAEESMRRLWAQGRHSFTAETVDGVEELRVEALVEAVSRMVDTLKEACRINRGFIEQTLKKRLGMLGPFV